MTRGFVSDTAWFLDKLRASSSQKWRALGRSLSAKCATGYSLVTLVLPTTSKLPFFVGAPGFEPGTSWSRKLLHSRNAAISGQFSKFELHGVHRISQTVHNLLTLTGGPKEHRLARGAMRGPISARRIPISSHQRASRMIHDGVPAQTGF